MLLEIILNLRANRTVFLSLESKEVQIRVRKFAPVSLLQIVIWHLFEIFALFFAPPESEVMNATADQSTRILQRQKCTFCLLPKRLDRR